MIESATDLIEKINANTALRPYLKNYPFTGNNVTITMFLTYPNGRKIFYPKIKIAAFFLDKLRYSYDTPETDGVGGYYLVETETFEEAKKIVESQSN